MALQEEEQKKIGIGLYASRLEKLQITENVVDEIRNNLVSQLRTLEIPFGQDVVMINETLSEINEIINDEVWNDVYSEDKVTMLFKNYMKLTRNYDFKNEMALRAMGDSIIKILEKITDLGIKPKHTPIEDDGSLNEDERNALKDKAIRWILLYKKFREEKRNVTYMRLYSIKLYEMADTQAKYEMINNLLFEHTGEYVLDKIKKEKENRDKEAKKEKEKMKRSIEI